MAGAVKVGDTKDVSVHSPHPYRPMPIGDAIVWIHTFQRPGATFVRLHFGEETLLDPGGHDHMDLRDSEGRVAQSLSWDEAADRWSRIVEGESLTVELWSSRGGGGHGVVIDQVTFGTAPLFPMSTVAGDGYVPICTASESSRIRLADPVARLIFQDDCHGAGGGGAFSCSSWLFSPNGHLMTNAHCANSQMEANSAEIWFNFMDPSCSLGGHPVPDRYSGDYNPTNGRGIKFERMNCNLDYSVLIVNDPSKGNPADVYGFLDISLVNPPAGTELWLPQHPFGMTKQIAEDCEITQNPVSGFNGCSDPSNGCPEDGTFVGSSDLRFNCITDQGSSGSPILNTNNQVVALAHAGSPVDPLVNYAVRMNAISTDLPNVPVELHIEGPATVAENESAQYRAVVSYLLTADRNVTTATDWAVASSSIGTIDDLGLFQANAVSVDRTTTVSGTYTQSGVTLTGSMRVTILNVPDPLTITESVPPNDSVDAGQTSDLEGSKPLGWQVVDLTFNRDVSTIVPTDFSVTQEGGQSTAPDVISAIQLEVQVIQVVFSEPIRPGAWTLLTHLPSGTAARLGYLPGDVDGNHTTDAQDIVSLIGELDEIAAGFDGFLPMWSSDIDRSNGRNPLDLLRAADLLLGADALDSWNGVSLP